MAEAFDMGVNRQASGDQYSNWLDEVRRTTGADKAPASPLDGPEMRKLHRRLMDWFFHERAKQAENRMEMALDADFYDGIQWNAEDSEAVSARGQVPLVFNEVAPMCDWLIGTERRSRVDWKVLPRTEDDVKAADAKTKVLKYVSDINRVPFTRSRAFNDCVKVGLGWLDDGARDDPTQDVLYSKYEDWRNVLHDSSGYDLDISVDARFVFRWRWVDEDIAMLMFEARKEAIRRAVIDSGTATEGAIDSDWYLGEPIVTSGSLYASGAGVVGEVSRRRIKLIECQFRMPAKSRIIADGPLKGTFLNPNDFALEDAVRQHGSEVVEKVMMRTHFAVFTEASMLSYAPSLYRHNRYTLTPIWCYRRGKDRLPYGAIRRVRDIQQDMNKRASKALFMLSTNQIIAEKNAVDDKDLAREEADMPDGYIETNAGKSFEIRRDTDAATGQIQMMTLDAQAIQRTAGVNNENLGRQTNAVSGEAIKARQLQGSVSTTEPFDNLRLAVQIQGEKQLCLIEQFYTEEKVIRLTGNRGTLEWLKINEPERQPDGSVRYINDITAAAADFVVSEQDYAGTLRQVMFDSMTQIASKLPPELALRFLRMAYEYSDMPNKDAIADEIRSITGERDPNKEMTPEEMQQAEQQMAAQAEAMQLQRESAALALREQGAKVEKLTAEAEEIRARAGSGGMPAEFEQALNSVQSSAAQKLDAMAEQLRKVQFEAANKTMAIKSDADTKLEVARIQASSAERIAEIEKAGDAQMASLMARLDDLGKKLAEANSRAEEAARAAEKASKAADDATTKAAEAGRVAATQTETKPAAAPVAPPSVNITVEAGAFQVDARPQGGNKTVTLKSGGQEITGTIQSDTKPAAGSD